MMEVEGAYCRRRVEGKRALKLYLYRVVPPRAGLVAPRGWCKGRYKLTSAALFGAATLLSIADKINVACKASVLFIGIFSYCMC